MASLSDVHRAVLAKATNYVGPMEVSIVAFVAPNPFPRKFFYRSCTERCEDNSVCKVSIEGPRPKQCTHNALGNRNIAEFFRFELVLMDDTLMFAYGKPTLCACIWDAAWNLLHISAPTLAGMGSLEQLLYVEDCLKHLPCCNVTIRVNQGVAHIQELEIVNTTSILPQLTVWPNTITPGRPRLGSQPAARTTPTAAHVSRSRTPSAPNPRTPSDASSPLPHQYSTPASQQSSDFSSGVEEEDKVDVVADSGSIATVVRRLASAFSSSLDVYSSRNPK
ncbi:unnamed protein product [Calypogeia fissa]